MEMTLLKNSYVTPQDSTYEIGAILNQYKQQHLTIDRVEIFGFGGMEALFEREEHRKMLKQLRDKKKKVDKAAFLESDFDKEFLLGNTFGHKKEQVERQDAG